MAGSTSEAELTVRQVQELRLRLRDEYRLIALDVVDQVVDDAWDHTVGSRVQQYRLILAERRARQALERTITEQARLKEASTSAQIRPSSTARPTAPSRSVASSLR